MKNAIANRHNHNTARRPTHLTRRGERLIGTLLTAAVIGGGYVTVKHEFDASEPLKAPAAGVSYREATLDAGGTMWDMAKSAFPNTDPRRVVPMLEGQIPEEYNGMPQPGEVFKLPANAEIGTLVTVEQNHGK